VRINWVSGIFAELPPGAHYVTVTFYELGSEVVDCAAKYHFNCEMSADYGAGI
jgi:hypothetical protein